MSELKRLDVAADQWWHDDEPGQRLKIDVVYVEPAADEDGTVSWATVWGWRVLPNGRRRWAKEIVRAEALASGAGGWTR